MQDLTLFDAAVAAVILISSILAFSRGFTREIMSIGGWIAAGFIAFVFAPQLVPFISEIPVVSDLVGTNCELGVLASFAVVFAGSLVIIALFTPLISGAIQKSPLEGIDGALGFLFGLARGALMVVVMLVGYDFIIAEGDGFPMIEESKSKLMFAEQRDKLKEFIPTDIPEWLIDPYNSLTADCKAPATPIEATPAPSSDTLTPAPSDT